MSDQFRAEKTNKEAEPRINKHYGYDNWYWLMDQPLGQNLNDVNTEQDRT